MNDFLHKIKSLASSGTAKDTYVLFIGNVLSAFWGFLFTLIVARSLSIYDFGVFSAALNLVIILTSLADVGISSASVAFVSEHHSAGNIKKSNEYIKAAFIVRTIFVLTLSSVVILFAPFVSNNFLATNDASVAIWSAVIPIFLFPDMFFPYILQAKKKFIESVIIDNAFYLGRLAMAFAFYLIAGLTMTVSFASFGMGFLITVILTLVYVKSEFFYAKPGFGEYKSLLKFSGWIAVNRVISSISGRLDIQMLAAMMGAVATGLYSIPSRISSFIIVFAGSFSSVLATRFASFDDKEKEKSYIIKSMLALIPICGGVVIAALFAKPFITILFGEKYLSSVPILQALLLSQIPFLMTVPAVSAIIYSMKKTVYIGAYSFFQVAAIFLLNVVFIPKYGIYGPAITYGMTNVILFLYTGAIVYKHYWSK